jgi:flagellar protein FliO/FliZ
VLCLFVAGLWLALRWLKKRGTLRRFGGNADMAMESRLSLGPKKNLLIVRLRDRRLLLGITEHHISKLAELPLYYYDEEEDGQDNDEGKKHA